MSQSLIVFDMDGVLVDVTASYRETILDTIEHFTGKRPAPDLIQDYKNQGGWNDDWLLAHHLIQKAGGETPYEKVVDHFQTIFHGTGAKPGLMTRERWIASDGLFARLAARHRLAVFTGRLRWEALKTLDRFLPNVFDPIVGNDNVANPKPAPDGLLKIRAEVPHEKIWYLGDTVDDAKSSRLANVPFIGIASATSLRRDELRARLREEGAAAVIESINDLEEAIGDLELAIAR